MQEQFLSCDNKQRRYKTKHLKMIYSDIILLCINNIIADAFISYIKIPASSIQLLVTFILH